MNRLRLLQQIEALKDLILARALDDPAAPEMHRQLLQAMEAQLREELFDHAMAEFRAVIQPIAPVWEKAGER